MGADSCSERAGDMKKLGTAKKAGSLLGGGRHGFESAGEADVDILMRDICEKGKIAAVERLLETMMIASGSVLNMPNLLRVITVIV